MFWSRVRLVNAVLILVAILSPTLPGFGGTKAKPARPPDVDYPLALGAADRLLEAWHSRDLESGITLLSSRAKEKATEEDLEGFFSNGEPSAYELGHGKKVGAASYEFPVVLFNPPKANRRVSVRFSSIVVSRTGNNDWVIDKLP
jgi:hypothetical protein